MLHTEVVGQGRPRFAFLHGLFGRGRNWTQVATALAEDGYPGVLFDLPDHGRSSWSERFSYPAMAEAVAEEIELRMGSAAGLILVGHSMGGKVAMLTALTRPELIHGLVVIDIAPAPSAQVSSFDRLIEALLALPLDQYSTRAEVDAALSAQVPEPELRLFLLQNLRRKGGWHWQPNLNLIADSLPAISAWPQTSGKPYPGPTLWLAGADSNYVRPEHDQAMRDLFPQVQQVIIPGAGHWVHADAPHRVIDELLAFVRAIDNSR